MQFSSLYLAATALAVVNALVELTNSNYDVTAGSPFKITWSASAGPVTLILKTGENDVFQTVSTIATGLPGDSYTWSVPADIKDETYAIYIDDGLTNNYGAPFTIDGAVESESSSSASASKTSVSSSSSASSTVASITTSSSEPSSTTSSSSNSTTSSKSSSTSSSSEETSATKTTSSPTSTGTANIPNSNSGAAELASPLALVFLTVAALISLN